MNIQLLNGRFEANEGLQILSEMIQVKIRFHEAKIQSDSSEEDVKRRENRIRQLQNELEKIRSLKVSEEADQMEISGEFKIEWTSQTTISSVQ